MSAKSEHEKRASIAGELADLRLRQAALCRLGSKLARTLPACCREAWREIIAKDERDGLLIETAIVSFGVRAEPTDATRRLVALEHGGTGDVIDRLFLYAVLKHEQLLAGRLVAKATLMSPRDVKEALGFLASVQDSIERNEAALLEVIQEVGLYAMMGEEPAQGFVERVREAAASVADAVLSRIARPAGLPDIDGLLKLDHRRILVLFDEIDAARELEAGQDLFHLLAADLRAHVEAEERAVYTPFESRVELRDELDEHRIEHDAMRDCLLALEQMTPEAEHFTARLRELRRVVREHFEGEEDRVIPRIRHLVTLAERTKMTADFKRVKEEIQSRPAAAAAAATRHTARTRASGSRLGFGVVRSTARPAAPMGGP